MQHGQVAIIAEKRNSPEPFCSGEFLSCSLQSVIAVANIDVSIGCPLPAAIVDVEVMAMAVKAMPVMMAVPVVAVSVVTMSVMAVMAVAAAGESLAWAGQRRSCQHQGSDCG
jgi:hypothetical protein